MCLALQCPNIFYQITLTSSVTSKKSPNIYKGCPKMISLEKCMILTPSQKLPNNVGHLGKIIDTFGFECLPEKQISPNLVTLLTRILYED